MVKSGTQGFLHGQWPRCQGLILLAAKPVTKTRRETGMCRDKSDQHPNSQRDPPNSPWWQCCHRPGHHGVPWISKVTSKTNWWQQLMNRCPQKSHHRVIPFSKLLGTNEAPGEAPSWQEGLSSQRMWVHACTHSVKGSTRWTRLCSIPPVYFQDDTAGSSQSSNTTSKSLLCLVVPHHTFPGNCAFWTWLSDRVARKSRTGAETLSHTCTASCRRGRMLC